MKLLNIIITIINKTSINQIYNAKYHSGRYLTIAVFSFLIAFLCSSATSSAEVDALTDYENGLWATENNRLELANYYYKKAIAVEPNDGMMRIGMMYYEYAPNEMLRKNMTTFKGLGKRFVIEKIAHKLENGFFARTKGFFKTMYTASASSANALRYYENGVRAMDDENLELAKYNFEKAISIEPDDKRLRIGMMYYDYAPNTSQDRLRIKCIEAQMMRLRGKLALSTNRTQ